MEAETVKDLVLRYQNGDDTAFTGIYESLASTRRHFVRKYSELLLDEAEAISQVDEAILKAIKDWDKSKSNSCKFESFAWNIINFHYLNICKSRFGKKRTTIRDSGECRTADLTRMEQTHTFKGWEDDEGQDIEDPNATMPFDHLIEIETVEEYLDELQLFASPQQMEIVNTALQYDCTESGDCKKHNFKPKDISTHLRITVREVDRRLGALQRQILTGRPAWQTVGYSEIGAAKVCNRFYEEWVKTKEDHLIDGVFVRTRHLLDAISERYRTYESDIRTYLICVWSDETAKTKLPNFYQRLKERLAKEESDGNFKKVCSNPFLHFPILDDGYDKELEVLKDEWFDDKITEAELCQHPNGKEWLDHVKRLSKWADEIAR